MKTEDVFGAGKTVVFGVPGAFTPGCSATHLPGYVSKSEEIKSKGAKIVCVSVNDPFVMVSEAKGDGVGPLLSL